MGNRVAAGACIGLAALAAGCTSSDRPCGSWDDVEIVVESGGDATEAQIRQELEAFRSWSGRDTVCVERIDAVAQVLDGEQFAGRIALGSYEVHSRVIEVAAEPADELPLTLRHELCHAFEWAENLAGGAWPAFDPDEDWTLNRFGRDLGFFPSREVFARACEQAPLPTLEAAFRQSCMGGAFDDEAVGLAHQLITGLLPLPLPTHSEQLVTDPTWVDLPYAILGLNGGTFSATHHGVHGNHGAVLLQRLDPEVTSRLVLWRSDGELAADVLLPRRPHEPGYALLPSSGLVLLRSHVDGRLVAVDPATGALQTLPVVGDGVLGEAGGVLLRGNLEERGLWQLQDLASGSVRPLTLSLQADEAVGSVDAVGDTFELATDRRLLVVDARSGSVQSWPGVAAARGAGLGPLPDGGRLGLLTPNDGIPGYLYGYLAPESVFHQLQDACSRPYLAFAEYGQLDGVPAVLGWSIPEGFGATRLGLGSTE